MKSLFSPLASFHLILLHLYSPSSLEFYVPPAHYATFLLKKKIYLVQRKEREEEIKLSTA